MNVIQFASLDIEKVLYLHVKIIEKAGGTQGIRDFTLLHSALERPKASFGNTFLYPNLLHMAAALLHSLIMNHAFLDGNKRTAYEVTKYFLYENGFVIKATSQEKVNFCLAVDNEGWQIKEIVDWFETHTVKIK
ncbi:MAG TPA: type II toxin-antitoxin system death-on-curing family toxin [Patescibacteria group bacterium]